MLYLDWCFDWYLVQISCLGKLLFKGNGEVEKVERFRLLKQWKPSPHSTNYYFLLNFQLVIWKVFASWSCYLLWFFIFFVLSLAYDLHTFLLLFLLLLLLLQVPLFQSNDLRCFANSLVLDNRSLGLCRLILITILLQYGILCWHISIDFAAMVVVDHSVASIGVGLFCCCSCREKLLVLMMLQPARCVNLRMA